MLSFFYTIKSLILPPGCLIILLVIGLCCWRWRRLSFILILIAVLLLYLLSLQPVAVLLAKPLQTHYPALNQKAIHDAKAGAIVILSGGRIDAPEYGKVISCQDELMRLRYGAYLYRQTHLPMLVSGGVDFVTGPSQAEIMKQTLKEAFYTPTKWMENRSRNTWENAKYSIEILKANHIKKVFLVTDAMHMPRAVYAFHRFGMDVIPAPTNFIFLSPVGHWWQRLLPGGLDTSAYGLHEYIGLVWYHLK